MSLASRIWAARIDRLAVKYLKYQFYIPEYEEGEGEAGEGEGGEGDVDGGEEPPVGRLGVLARYHVLPQITILY